MAKVAMEGSTIQEIVVSSHISTQKYEYVGSDFYYNPIYDWVSGYTTSAYVNGSVKANGVTNVYINGKLAVANGDSTIETDRYSLGSSERLNGSGGVHTNVTNGRVTSGNNKSVYANGKSISVEGSTVTNHVNRSTTISSNVSSNVYIGG